MKKLILLPLLLLLATGVSGFEYSISSSEMSARCAADGGRWVSGEGCKCPVGQRYYGWSAGCGRADISPWTLCYEKYGNWRWNQADKKFTCECQRGWKWGGNIQGCVSSGTPITTSEAVKHVQPTGGSPFDRLINLIKSLFNLR